MNFTINFQGAGTEKLKILLKRLRKKIKSNASDEVDAVNAQDTSLVEDAENKNRNIRIGI
jgi:uncharacterized protein with von Willebrand factor type A (vWA) domain